MSDNKPSMPRKTQAFFIIAILTAAIIGMSFLIGERLGTFEEPANGDSDCPTCGTTPYESIASTNNMTAPESAEYEELVQYGIWGLGGFFLLIIVLYIIYKVVTGRRRAPPPQYYPPYPAPYAPYPPYNPYAPY